MLCKCNRIKANKDENYEIKNPKKSKRNTYWKGERKIKGGLGQCQKYSITHSGLLCSGRKERGSR